MQPTGAQREAILEALERLGGPSRENIAQVARETLVPEADVYGVATFYQLIDKAHVTRRVCQGLSCAIAGSGQVARELREAGEVVQEVSCLGQCDRPVPVLDQHHELISGGKRGPVLPDDPALPINLGGQDSKEFAALARVREMGAEAFLEELAASGLQGRGGAGFPAAIKWRAVRGQAETERYVICNADEGEPGTFKDREVMLRRPLLLLEGLAIAATVVQADDIYLYVRGEFRKAWRQLEAGIRHPALAGFRWHLVAGHGAYICGEETALIEALEGRRGMPRIKPPYPTEAGFRGKPTLMNNVETLACVPSIALRGGAWFKGLGRGEAGTKLYCVSGHVNVPGVYELPLGSSLDEVVKAAGGYLGTPKAFSPGGASSGFLPMRFRSLPLDFRNLAEAGSMLGSAGLVVLNDTVDIAQAAANQAQFYEDESCGQCAPCRIGARMLNQATQHYLGSGQAAELDQVQDIAWEMEEGSICGLGMAAPLPLTSAMRHFPEAFQDREQA